MISIAICTGDQQESARLSQMVCDWLHTTGAQAKVCTYSTSEEFLLAYARNRYAILFLDVGLAGTPGLEVARKLRQNGDNCQIVFLSRDSSPALTCYQVHPAGFFLKPVFPHQLQELLNWNRNIFLSTMNSITVVFARRPRKLLLADILYINVSGRTSQICLAQEIIPTNRALNELQASLPSPQFFRCHRRYLVNRSHVAGMDGRNLLLDNGVSVPVSEAQLAETKNWALGRS